MNGSSPPRPGTGIFTRLVAPRKTWRAMSGGARYIAYARISLQLIGVAMLLANLLPLVGILGVGSPGVGDGSPAGTVLILVVAAISLGLMVIVLELHPALNSRPRRDVAPFFRVGLTFTLLAWGGSLLLAVLDLPDDRRVAGVFSAVWLLFNLSMTYLPWLRWRWLWLSGLGLVTMALGHRIAIEGTLLLLWFLGMATLLGTVRVTVWTIEFFREVEAARQTEAVLKVTEERLRFAQELHDTLGQHLAVMSLKAELSLALARRGDQRLEGELAELQRLARTSMSEMREVVAGYREINLATEVAGARSLLADSGITLEVVGDVLGVARQDRELAAWFVREAATNVLRHSDADRARLVLEPGLVSMSNDGAGQEIRALSGLKALRRRAENTGAQLLVERDGGNFTASLILGGQP